MISGTKATLWDPAQDVSKGTKCHLRSEANAGATSEAEIRSTFGPRINLIPEFGSRPPLFMEELGQDIELKWGQSASLHDPI